MGLALPLIDMPMTGTALPPAAKLEVWLQGASDFPESPDHHARLFVNGTYVGDEEWNGKEPRRIEIALSAGILREGENSLEIEGLQDTGALYSMFFLDIISQGRQA